MFSTPPVGYVERVPGIDYEYDYEPDRGNAPNGTNGGTVCPGPFGPTSTVACVFAGPVGVTDVVDIASVMATIPDVTGRLYEIGIGYSTGAVNHGFAGCASHGCGPIVRSIHLEIGADLRDGSGNPGANTNDATLAESWVTIPPGDPVAQPSYLFIVNPTPPSAVPVDNTAREQLFERAQIPDTVTITYDGEWTTPITDPNSYLGAALALQIRVFDPLGSVPEPGEGFMCVL